SAVQTVTVVHPLVEIARHVVRAERAHVRGECSHWRGTLRPGPLEICQPFHRPVGPGPAPRGRPPRRLFPFRLRGQPLTGGDAECLRVTPGYVEHRMGALREIIRVPGWGGRLRVSGAVRKRAITPVRHLVLVDVETG